MSWIEFLSLVGLAYSAAWTPGPNNTLAASFGANHGFRAGLGHIVGVGFGFPLMIFCVGIGLGLIFQQSPLLREVLRWGGAAILIWMSWKIATSGPPGKGKTVAPFSVLQSASFQWINPKGWIMAISITSQFADGDHLVKTVGIVALVFVTAGFTSATAWTLFGQVISTVLKTPLHWTIFNIIMALGLLGSVILIIASDLI